MSRITGIGIHLSVFTNGSELLDGRCTQRPYFVSSFPISFLSKRCSFLL